MHEVARHPHGGAVARSCGDPTTGSGNPAAISSRRSSVSLGESVPARTRPTASRSFAVPFAGLRRATAARRSPIVHSAG